MLNIIELNDIQNIESKYYMKPIIDAINLDILKNNLKWHEVFDRLYNYLENNKDTVKELTQKRVKEGKIINSEQAIKSIAGGAFSNLIIWVFLKNKENNYIKENIFITSNIIRIKEWQKLFLIKVGEETQKPDVDLVIYSLNSNNDLNKCLILSLKTSLRERAGQTYKWKLLMEIAKEESKLKDKYDISYNPPVLPLVCFATVNFYNEINNPQNRGMFKFFDCAFIGKNIETKDFIKPLSYIIEYVNKELS